MTIWSTKYISFRVMPMIRMVSLWFSMKIDSSFTMHIFCMYRSEHRYAYKATCTFFLSKNIRKSNQIFWNQTENALSFIFFSKKRIFFLDQMKRIKSIAVQCTLWSLQHDFDWSHITNLSAFTLKAEKFVCTAYDCVVKAIFSVSTPFFCLIDYKKSLNQT